MLNRVNQVERREEKWRPPNFRVVTGPFSAALAAVRRSIDFQAGSVWRDLARILPQLRGVILDVGCGAQPYRSLIAADAIYRGIDTTNSADQFGYTIPDTTYFTSDRWPIDDHTVDAVLCTEVLEHVAEPLAFLAEAGRCLKSGGRLVLTVPFAARWHYIPHDYWRFTPSGLRHLLTTAGFQDVQVFARGNAVTVACYKVAALLIPLLVSGETKLARRAPRLILGILMSPVLFLLMVVANLSLLCEGGDDCLGYTALARKPGAAAAQLAEK